MIKKQKPKSIKSKLTQDLIDFAYITQLYDSYLSQKLIIVDKGFARRILIIFKKYFAIISPNVPKAVSFSCFI